MHFTVVIPARYASTRLPGKPLMEIAGKPMIQHVHANAQASGAAEVIIATDDERIREAAVGFGAKVCMTSPDHTSGTERIAEVVEVFWLNSQRIVVNVQADEPLLPPGLIQQVAMNLFHRPNADVATLCERITDGETLFESAAVKVVMDKDGFALYFSRAPIPWDRDYFTYHPNSLLPDSDYSVGYYRHIGIYAYRASFLSQYVAFPRCALEKTESLEQLRVLYQGGKIHVAEAQEPPGVGVDTPADLMRVQRAMTDMG